MFTAISRFPLIFTVNNYIIGLHIWYGLLSHFLSNYGVIKKIPFIEDFMYDVTECYHNSIRKYPFFDVTPIFLQCNSVCFKICNETKNIIIVKYHPFDRIWSSFHNIKIPSKYRLTHNKSSITIWLIFKSSIFHLDRIVFVEVQEFDIRLVNKCKCTYYFKLRGRRCTNRMVTEFTTTSNTISAHHH